MSTKKFEAFEIAVELIAALRPLVTTIAQQDKDLADQIKRAASSIPLNLAEGRKRVGRDRGHCFRIASGSAAEVRAALAVAQAWGYVDAEVGAQARALLDRELAMLWRLTHP